MPAETVKIMSVKLNDIVPWGRTMDEYQRMFGLSASGMAGGILGCGDGPASFNAEVVKVNYQLQRNGDKMLRVYR